MTQIIQEEAIRTRLTYLKTYLHDIRQQIQVYQKPKSKLLYSQPPYLPQVATGIIEKHQTSKRNILRQQIQKLQKQIKSKTQFIFGTSHKINQILMDSNRSIPLSVKVYQTRFNYGDSLEKLVSLVSQDEFDLYAIYMSKMCMVLMSQGLLEVARIQFITIAKESVSTHDKYIKFATQSEKKDKNERIYLIQLKDQREAHMWYTFINQVSESKFYAKDPEMKWVGAAVKCKQQIQKQQYSPSFHFERQDKNGGYALSSNQGSEISKIFSSKVESISKFDNPSKKYRKASLNSSHSIFNIKKSHRKYSQKSSSFFLSTESDKNQNIELGMIKIKEEEFAESIKFEDIQQEDRMQLEVNEREKQERKEISKRNSRMVFTMEAQESEYFNPVKNLQSSRLKTQELLMTQKVLSKLQQKNKLLADSSLTKLSIHWNEEPEQKYQYAEMYHQPRQKQLESLNQIQVLKKKRSLSLKRSLSRKNSKEPPSRYQRIQSNQDNYSQAEFERGRKKTDYSLQEDNAELQTQRKNSNNKNEIKHHYLHKLAEKQTIRQMNKSNSHEGSSSRKQLINLIPIPQKRSKRKTIQPSHVEGRNKFEISSYDGSSSHSRPSKQSTQQQIQVQQLKNGIVLEKCSKDAWNTKEKKLYLSNTMAQICYCDIQNPLQQKKIFLKDVKSIEYGKVSRGILKHKKRYDESRCLLIRIKRDGKQKILEFYLEDSEPVYNLQEFAKKLQNFIEKESENEQSIQ